MHIEYFDYFYQVAKMRSISKVAKQIHISQSALSQQIQKLEDSLGFTLLERSNKGVVLTDMGEVVLKYSENIINTYKKMMVELEKGSTESNQIHIEACSSVSNYAIPCSLYKIKEKYPAHKYELITNISEKIKGNVLNDISSVGFVYENTNEKELQYHKVGTNKFVLIASHYYNIPKTISLSQLFDYPLIALSAQDELREKLDSMLRKHQRYYDQLKILFVLDSIEAVKSSINREHGLAFLPYISVKEELYNKQFKIVSIDEFDLDMSVYMICKKNTSQPKVVDEFIQMFKQIGEKSFC